MRKNQLRACIMSGLACGVMMGVMGLTITSVQAETYTEEIMTEDGHDLAYYKDVMRRNYDRNEYIYDFRREKETEISGYTVPTITVLPDHKANVCANTLKLKSEADYLYSSGAMVNDKGVLSLNAKTILISSNMNLQNPNYGIAMWHTAQKTNDDSYKGGYGEINVNGELIIKNDIDGNVGQIKRSFQNHPDYGITRENYYCGFYDTYKGGRWLPAGILGGLSAGSVMNFNAPVYVAVKGTAVQSDPYYKWQGISDEDLMTININKGGYILTPIDKNTVSYSTANFGGTININVPEVNGKRVLGNSPVYMVGNAIVMKDDGRGGEYFFRNGRTNIALTTPDSYWRGGIDNTGANQIGKLNLYIQNGAKWICEQTGALNGMRGDEMPEVESKGHYGNYDGVHHVNYLRGGKTEVSAGILQQEDARPIYVKSYSGHMKVLYSDPNGDNTFANRGSLTIDQAQKGSGIVIMPIGDINENTAKNILINKVIYKGNHQNLSKKVQVGEGLLRSARMYSAVFMMTPTSKTGDDNVDISDIGEGGDSGTGGNPGTGDDNVDIPDIGEGGDSGTGGNPGTGDDPGTPTPNPELEPELKPTPPPEPKPEEKLLPEPDFNELIAPYLKEKDKYVKGYISGNPDKDSSWIKEKAYKGNGIYEFTEDTWIEAEADKSCVVAVTEEGTPKEDSKGSAIEPVDIYIKAPNKKIGFTLISKNRERVAALSNYFTKGGTLTIEAKEIHVLSAKSGDGRTEGIGMKSSCSEKKSKMTLNGNVYINSFTHNGGAYLLGVYTAGNAHLCINGDVVIMGANKKQPYGVIDLVRGKPNPVGMGGVEYFRHGLYAGAEYTIQAGGYIEVNGNVYLKIVGNGIMANGDGSRVDISGGGHVEVEHSRGCFFSMVAQSGVIHINTNKEGTEPHFNKLVIKGDIGLMAGSVHPNERSKVSEIVAALTTPDSSFIGRVFIGFTEKEDKLGYQNRTALFLQNGATWYNQRYNESYFADQYASKVTELYGGKDEAHAGIIVMEAYTPKAGSLEKGSAGDIQIGMLEGHLKVIYPHQYNGKTGQDFDGGNIIVKKAKTGSFITAVTDIAGDIDVTSLREVEMVFGALARRFTYENVSKEPDNLKGKVVIAEGLLSSRYLVEAPIDFGDERGKINKKYIRKSKQDMSDNPKPSIIITDGDFETGVMKGIRSSIFSAISMYRAHSNDVLKRLGDVRLFKADTGIWAKYQGGHTDIDAKDKNNVHVQLGQKYNMLQVGFDKRINPATLVGAAFDYGTTTDTYEFGTGKGHIGGLALYGMMMKDDGLYVDVIGKFGKMKADYDVETKDHAIYKVIGEKASGSYEAMATSLSMEVGKRIERTQGFYMEPKAELTLGYIGEHSHDVVSEKGNRMNVKQKPLLSVVGKLGLLLGRTTEKGSMFAGAMVAHEFGGNLDTVFSVGKKSKTVSMDLKDTWFELEAGGTWKTSENSYIYGTLSKNFGAFVNEKWRIDAGIRLAF